MRLAARLTILFLSLSIFPLAVMGSLAYNSGRQAIVHNSMNHLISTNVLKADEYNRWIEGEARLLGSLAQRPLVREDAAVLASTDPADPVYQAAREDIIQNHLAPSVEEKSGFLSLSVLRASDGLVFVSTDRRLEGQYRGSEPFFVEGERGTYVDSVRYFESEQGTAKHISTPIQDRQGNLVAVLVGRADLAVVSEIMWQRSGLSASEDTYLVDASSFFVTEPRFGGDYALKQAVHTEGVEACLAHRNGVGFYENYQGVPVIGAYRWIPARELCILTEVAQAEALVPIVALRATTLKIAAGAILAVVVLGLFYARTITRPVGQLVRGVGEIGRGNLDYRLAVRSQDEVGQLAGAFNAMAADLERLSRETHAWTAELEQRVEERTVALQEAEVRYRSLVEQIPAIIYTDSAEQVGQTLYISPQLKTTMGYAPEEWIADNELWLKIMPADDRERVSAEYVRANESGEPFRAEYRVVTPDGRTVWIRDEALLKRGLSGQPSFWQGIMLDISERKLNEAALQKAKEELERRNARLQALYRVGQAVNSTLETGAILDHLVGEAMRLTRATHGQVLVVREDLGLFEHRSLRGFSPEEAKLARLVPLPLDRGASGQAYTTRQAVCVDDVQAVPGYFPLIPTTRAEIAVPLVRGGQVLGNLDLQSPEVGAFHNLDLDYLEALADQASIALEKVRLYDEVRRRNEELALLNRVITASATSHDGEAILQTVCRELALAFGVPHSTATLLNPEKTEAVVVAEYLVESRPSALGAAALAPAQNTAAHPRRPDRPSAGTRPRRDAEPWHCLAAHLALPYRRGGDRQPATGRHRASAFLRRGGRPGPAGGGTGGWSPGSHPSGGDPTALEHRRRAGSRRHYHHRHPGRHPLRQSGL
jgi:PAS domain S-box-containing protein